MTKVISIAGLKGGCGKSTMTAIMASVLAYTYDKSVVVVDCDTNQHTLVKNREEDIASITPYETDELDENGNKKKAVDNYNVYKEVYTKKKKAYPIVSAAVDVNSVMPIFEQYDEKVDYIFLDMPGSIDNVQFFNLIQNTDVVFIPFVVDPYDFDANYPFAKVLYTKILKNTSTRMSQMFYYWNKFDGKIRKKMHQEMEEILKKDMPDMVELENKIAMTSSVTNPMCRSTLVAPMGKYGEWGNIVNTVDEMVKSIL